MKMVNTIVALSVIVVTSFAFAGVKGPGDVGSVTNNTIGSSQVKLAPANIDQIVRLVDKTSNGTQKKLQILALDNGMSTDLSPRYQIYLGYASLSEMSNLVANFEISNKAYKFISASRISAGIYEVKLVELDEVNGNYGFVNATYAIDATKMYADEKAAIEKCGTDFCDGDLTTSIVVKRTAVKASLK